MAIILHRVFLVGTGKASTEKIPELVKRVKDMAVESRDLSSTRKIEYVDFFCPSIGEAGTKVETTLITVDD